MEATRAPCAQDMERIKAEWDRVCLGDPRSELEEDKVIETSVQLYDFTAGNFSHKI